MDQAGDRAPSRSPPARSRPFHVGIPAMDDQRQLGLARRLDMHAEDLGLPVPGTVVVVEIQPGLADPHHLGMLGQLHKAIDAGGILRFGLMGMDADGAVDMVIPLGDRPHPVELPQLGAYGYHGVNATAGGPRHDGVKLAVEILEVQMAVAVDQHAPCPALGRAPRFDKLREDTRRIRQRRAGLQRMRLG